MTDSSSSSDDLLVRYVSGDMSREERRTLTRQALHDQELFDALLTVGLLKEAMVRDRTQETRSLMPLPESSSVRRRSGPRVLAWAATAAAAAVLVMALILWLRPFSAPPAGTVVEYRPAPVPAVQGGKAPLPTLLALRLDLPQARTGRPPVRGDFAVRASGPERNLAKAEGAIVSTEPGDVRIDLGTIDGLEDGMVLLMRADPVSNLQETRATVTATFRAEARVDVAGEIRPGRQVLVDPTTHLRALSEQLTDGVVARRGPFVQAAAHQARAVVRAGRARADVRRLVLMQLAAWSKSLADGAAAEVYVRDALGLIDKAPIAGAEERAEILNALGTLIAADGRLPEAEQVLQEAKRVAPNDRAISAHILNNLGVVAASRRDFAEAASRYRSALAAAALTNDGRLSAIENNLSLLEASR